MRTLCFILALVGLVVSGPVRASELQEGIDRFREGRRTWNAAEMEAARRQFAAIVKKRPADYEPRYWNGVCGFYLLLCYGLEDSTGYDSQKAEALLDPLGEELKAAIDRKPDEAECRALLSSVYGFRILMNPFSAVWNGPRVLSLQGDALENEPDNPRVHYVIGAGYFRAPKIFRNVDKARDLLEKADRLFENQPTPDADDPRWGRAECKGLLGDLYREQGEPDSARTFYRAALELNPNYLPARTALKEMDDGNKK